SPGRPWRVVEDGLRNGPSGTARAGPRAGGGPALRVVRLPHARLHRLAPVVRVDPRTVRRGGGALGAERGLVVPGDGVAPAVGGVGPVRHEGEGARLDDDLLRVVPAQDDLAAH